jgi:branched-chain amino acid transport system substrate-binding protein
MKSIRLLAALVALVAAREAGANGGTLKIVSELPLSAGWFTPSLPNAIQMALEETGSRVCNGQWEVVYQSNDHADSDSWQPDLVTANANADVADPSIVGVLGTYNSGAARLMIPILNPAHLVMISPSNTANFLTKPGFGFGERNYARVVSNDQAQGAQQARWARMFGVSTAFIVEDGDDYGHEMADAFEEAAAGLTVIGRDSMRFTRGRSFDKGLLVQLAARVAARKPDLVVFAGFFNSGLFLYQLRRLGYTGLFMGDDGITEQGFIDDAGPVSEGAYGTINGISSDGFSGVTADWAARYTTLFGEAPVFYSIELYVATQVMLNAFERVCAATPPGDPSNRDAVRKEVMSTTNFDSVIGRFSFDADGDTTSPLVSGFRVRNGEWVFDLLLD